MHPFPPNYGALGCVWGGGHHFKGACINTPFKDCRRFLVLPADSEYILKNAFWDFMKSLALSMSVERQVGEGQKDLRCSPLSLNLDCYSG